MEEHQQTQVWDLIQIEDPDFKDKSGGSQSKPSRVSQIICRLLPAKN